MRKEVIAKQLLKIAKELVGLRVTMNFDFSTEEKEFDRFKKQHPKLKCVFMAYGGGDSYWQVSDGKKTYEITFDYFEKTDRYHVVFKVNGKQYPSLEEALNSLNFGIDFNDDWYKKLDFSTKKKVYNYLLKQYGEKLVLMFVKPYLHQQKQFFQKYFLDQLKDDPEYFIMQNHMEKDRDVIEEINANKNVWNNLQKLLDKYNKNSFKINLSKYVIWDYNWDNAFIIDGIIEYNIRDYYAGGKYYQMIVDQFDMDDISLSQKQKDVINTIVGY